MGIVADPKGADTGLIERGHCRGSKKGNAGFAEKGHGRGSNRNARLTGTRCQVN